MIRGPTSSSIPKIEEDPGPEGEHFRIPLVKNTKVVCRMEEGEMTWWWSW
jgi:hypothetical protein